MRGIEACIGRSRGSAEAAMTVLQTLKMSFHVCLNTAMDDGRNDERDTLADAAPEVATLAVAAIAAASSHFASQGFDASSKEFGFLHFLQKPTLEFHGNLRLVACMRR